MTVSYYPQIVLQSVDSYQNKSEDILERSDRQQELPFLFGFPVDYKSKRRRKEIDI